MPTLEQNLTALQTFELPIEAGDPRHPEWHTIVHELIPQINQRIAGGGSGEVFLSQLVGVTSGANLELGAAVAGATSTAVIQAMLNNLGDAPKVIHWDVAVRGFIDVPDNTLILCSTLAQGMILPNAANRPLVQNNRQHTGPTNGFGFGLNKNIRIFGGTWNANAAGQTAEPDNVQGWLVGVKMWGVDNFTMENCRVLTAKRFGVHINYCRNYEFRNFEVDQGPNPALYKDGIHLNGNCYNGVIENFKARCGDDAIGTNADDILPILNVSKPAYWNGMAGPIIGLKIKNLMLNGGLFGIRILSGSARMDDIDIDGVHGNTEGYSVLAGDNFWQDPANLTNAGPGNIGRIRIANVTAANTRSGEGYVNECSVNVTANVEELTIENCRRVSFEQDMPWLQVGSNVPNQPASNPQIGILRIINYSAQDKHATADSPQFLQAGGHIRTVIVANVVAHSDVPKVSGVFRKTGGSIDTITFVGANVDNIAHLFEELGGQETTRINASGIVHLSAGVNKATFTTSGTVPDICLGQYTGALPTTGNFTDKRGDGFDAPATDTGNETLAFTITSADMTPNGTGGVGWQQDNNAAHTSFSPQYYFASPVYYTGEAGSGSNFLQTTQAFVLTSKARFKLKGNTSAGLGKTLLQAINTTTNQVTDMRSSQHPSICLRRPPKFRQQLTASESGSSNPATRLIWPLIRSKSTTCNSNPTI
jgi:hypothetical protein